ncbi:hypothetical protein EQV77_16885 [Halobacillus fulvus]|nr:hypothetical protein EQV77_16885 [Halobacillus fulvus]
MRRILKIGGWVLMVVVIFFAGSALATLGAETTFKEKTLDLTTIDEEILMMMEERDLLQEELDGLRAEKEEIQALIDSRDSVQAEVDGLQADLEDTQSLLNEELEKGREEIAVKLEEEQAKLTDAETKLADVAAQIEEQEGVLASLSGQIEQAGLEPITLIAGQYVVGRDIPEGRYQVTNIGDGTNFFVYDSSGYPTVNTILGDGMVGSGDYLFFTSEGDMIETLGQVRLTPMEE